MKVLITLPWLFAASAAAQSQYLMAGEAVEADILARAVAPAQENCTSIAKEVMPSCAQKCYLAIASEAGCGELDFPCQCQEDKKAQLTTLMMPCVMSACNFGDLPSVIAGGSSVCSCAMATGGNEQKEAVPEQTPAPAMALPRQETGPSTTCEVVASPAGDCALHRPTFAPCGRDCLSAGIAEIGCGVDDFACQCAPDAQAALSSLARPCVEESCGNPSAVAIQWDASAMCACASGGRSTVCYTASAGATTGTTDEEDGEGEDSLQGVAGRYGVGVIVGVFTVVLVAAIAL